MTQQRMASTSRDDDPLNLSGFEPAVIESAVKGRGKKAPTELEAAKEARLSAKEKRLSTVGMPSVPASIDSKTPAPVDPPKKEPDKSVLLDKLHAYRERFPHLKKRNNVMIEISKISSNDCN